MNINEKPVLQVKNLTVRYGDGCPECKSHLEKNRCTVCGTVWAANDISLEIFNMRKINDDKYSLIKGVDISQYEF